MNQAPRRCQSQVADVSFEAVYRAERSKLIRYLMSMGVGQHQADDAVQAAFARAYGCWDQIRAPRAWLYKVALRESYRVHASAGCARSRSATYCLTRPARPTPATWSS